VSDVTSRPHSLYHGSGHANQMFGGYLPPQSRTSPPIPQNSSPFPLPGGHGMLPQSNFPPSTGPVPRHGHFPATSHDVKIQTVAAKLMRSFEDSTFADCVLSVNIRGHKTSFHLHAFLVADSPVLHELFNPSGGGPDSYTRDLYLFSQDRFLTVPAVKMALKTCYGEDPAQSMHQIIGSNPQDTIIHVALSFIAAGHLLGLREVVRAGTDLALQLLSLDNVEMILAAALQYLDQQSLFLDPVRGGGDFFSGVVAFIVSQLSHAFVLSIPAAPTEEPGLRPSSRRASINPRLDFIQFGQFNKPSIGEVVLSRILLSVPPVILKVILDPVERAPWMETLMAERAKHFRPVTDETDGDGSSAPAPA
jgi:hypothetical protein